ncbi:Hypothetical protein GLP15_615 [Giardia lamblia P15]|uniref:Uncharacterized protein n=1 Tax=Giardia intestinalis (strain P15) TaxID=658858 RepID=E1F582_GIAIA|nr:Hypothetical protein GLP15_615 [Giardia lamblia P15]
MNPPSVRPLAFASFPTPIKMSDDLHKPTPQKSEHIIDSSNLDCNSGLIARHFQVALTTEDMSKDAEPPLKILTDDFGKWHPIQLPAGAAPLTIQRAVTLLSRPAIKQRPTRRKSLGTRSLETSATTRTKTNRVGDLNEDNV